jgi:hypothetical protein
MFLPYESALRYARTALDFRYGPALHHIDRLPIVDLGERDVDRAADRPGQVGSDSL